MKKSFLNVSAVALVIALSLVSCNKTAKAVEEVNENTQETVQEVADQGAAELDTLNAKVDSLTETVNEAVEGEAK